MTTHDDPDTPDVPLTPDVIDAVREAMRGVDVDAMLTAVRAEGEIECAHCGGIPDGVLIVRTDEHEREHRICNDCAVAVLRWL